MPNNNPNGTNAFSGPNDKQPAYGDIKKLADLTAQAGLAPTATAINAPKRAQRKATGRSGSKSVAAAPSMIPPGAPQVPYEQVLAQFWQELAAEPGASPLVKEMAKRAAGA